MSTSFLKEAENHTFNLNLNRTYNQLQNQSIINFYRFALRYGPYFLGGAAFLTGAYLNNYFRMKFFLERYGRWSSYLPVSLVPCVGTVVFHSEVSFCAFGFSCG